MGGNTPKPKLWHILGFSEYLLICACSRSFKEPSGSIPEKGKIFRQGKEGRRRCVRSAGHLGIGGGGGLFHP